MDIINKLNRQLTKIKNILVQEVAKKEYSYNYFICETECKFLDIAELQPCLTSTKINNTIFLKGINELCVTISDIWNKDFQKLAMRKLKEDFQFQGKYLSGSTPLDFHALYIKESEIIPYNTKSGKENFVNKFDFECYNIAWISKRCNLILNYITAAYPETIPYNLIINEIDNHCGYNPNYINKECNNLFNYLEENYDKKGIIKFINIFYFLKSKKIDKNKFMFTFTQEKYKEFILSKYKIEIKKFEKAKYKFEEDEVPILYTFYNNFLKTLK